MWCASKNVVLQCPEEPLQAIVLVTSTYYRGNVTHLGFTFEGLL